MKMTIGDGVALFIHAPLGGMTGSSMPILVGIAVNGRYVFVVGLEKENVQKK